jgi:hypothetical protein
MTIPLWRVKVIVLADIDLQPQGFEPRTQGKA